MTNDDKDVVTEAQVVAKETWETPRVVAAAAISTTTAADDGAPIS